MGVLLTNPIRTAQIEDAISMFDRFATQIHAAVQELNGSRGTPALACERAPHRIAVCLARPSHMRVELEFSEADGTVRMTRLGHDASVISHLRLSVARTKCASLEQADYCRLAWQALRPLMESI